MAELWELICHHPYSGVPGAVVDLSPVGASHGRAIGLADGEFLIDGAAVGSGVVRCYGREGRVHVSATRPEWAKIGGIRGEVILRRGTGPGGFIIDSDSFRLSLHGDALVAWFASKTGSNPTQYTQIASDYDFLGQEGYRVPKVKWVTLGFLHDGFATMELYADGAVVARRTSILGPVNSPRPNGFSIGNGNYSQIPFGGEIDDVKIWRLNPRRLDDDFNARPVDDETADCLTRLRRELVAALRRHPECARQLGAAIESIIYDLVRQAVAKGPETQERLQRTAGEYSNLWRAGKVGGPEMVKLFTDLITWLRLVGIRPEDNAAISQLSDSECLKKIVSEISEPDCDKQAMALVSAIADALDGGIRRSAGGAHTA